MDVILYDKSNFADMIKQSSRNREIILDDNMGLKCCYMNYYKTDRGKERFDIGRGG